MVYPWYFTLFPAPIEIFTFLVVGIIWFLAETFGAMIPHQGFDKRSKDRGSGILIFVGVIVSTIVAFYFGISGTAMLPNWFFYPGIFLMVLGILIRQWAIRTLGRFFSIKMEIQADHIVIKNGPYRFVRHPSYTGMLFAWIGMGLVLQSWGGTLLIILIQGFAYWYRISVEERLLISELGDEYVKYLDKTKRLIPFIL
jgi:protein-S-isoprenylcysteine O-methyltransferase Ste14